MNWSRKLRLFEVIIAGVVPLKLCLTDIQLELFTRSSSAVSLYAAAEQPAPVRHSPLDEIALQVRSWKTGEARTNEGGRVRSSEVEEAASEGIVITDESYNPKFAERLQDFIFSRYRRLNSDE